MTIIKGVMDKEIMIFEAFEVTLLANLLVFRESLHPPNYSVQVIGESLYPRNFSNFQNRLYPRNFLKIRELYLFLRSKNTSTALFTIDRANILFLLTP